jgi:thiamine monophosphate synthase
MFYNKLLSKISIKNYKNTVSVHNSKEIVKANRLFKPKFLIISPIYLTLSHAKSKPLGALKLFKIVNCSKNNNFIIMGGVSKERYKKIKKLDFHNRLRGFASIRNI